MKEVLFFSAELDIKSYFFSQSKLFISICPRHRTPFMEPEVHSEGRAGSNLIIPG
jgi:hypothetical protein